MGSTQMNRKVPVSVYSNTNTLRDVEVPVLRKVGEATGSSARRTATDEGINFFCLGNSP